MSKRTVKPQIFFKKEYNSVVRQTRIKNHLSGLRIERFVKDDVNTAAALVVVCKRILTMSRQVPESHRGDPHKIEFLCNAVVGHQWAKEPLSRIATAGLSFQQLYAELEIAVQLERENMAAELKRKAAVTLNSTEIASINFLGQAGYTKGTRGKRKTFFKKPNCFNCGSTSHLVKNCPHAVNFSNAAARNIQKLRDSRTQHAVHLVLAHLCSELDEPVVEEEDDINSDHDDLKIFEQMLVLDTSAPSNEANTGDSELERIDIFAVEVDFEVTGNAFNGACIDSGAQKSVIGNVQAQAYIAELGDKNSYNITHHSKNKTFRFGDNQHECVGTLNIRMPVSDDVVIQFDAYIVPIDVPLLLGLDVLRKLKLIVSFENGSIQSPKGDWSINLVQKFGHLYIEWPPSVYYTEAELRRIHRHFYHPSTDKLLALINRSTNKHYKPGLRNDLNRIKKTCDTCQRLERNPTRFRVAMPTDNCVFNRTVGMDIMKLEQKSVLHVVDKDTKFSAARFFKRQNN